MVGGMLRTALALLVQGTSPAPADRPAESAPPPATAARDEPDEVVVTGRRSGPPLRGGEWEFVHTAPLGTFAGSRVPVAMGRQGRWRFCLGTTPIEDLVTLFVVRSSTEDDVVGCSRIAITVKVGEIRTARNCSVTYYARNATDRGVSAIGAVSPFNPGSMNSGAVPNNIGIAPNNIGMSQGSLVQQDSTPRAANRTFDSIGTYTSDRMELRFDSETRVNGEMQTVARIGSTLTGRRIGECPVAPQQ